MRARICQRQCSHLNRTSSSFAQFLPATHDLELRQVAMPALPRMSVECEALALRLGYAWKHAHLNNNHGRKDLSDGHNRAVSISRTALSPRSNHRRCASLHKASPAPLVTLSRYRGPRPAANQGHDLLSALPAEAPLDFLPTPRLQVNVLLHHALRIIDNDFLLLDRQIRAHIRARDLAAISAVTQMPARPGEQLVVVDGHADGFAETRCAEGIGEL